MVGVSKPATRTASRARFAGLGALWPARPVAAGTANSPRRSRGIYTAGRSASRAASAARTMIRALVPTPRSVRPHRLVGDPSGTAPRCQRPRVLVLGSRCGPAALSGGTVLARRANRCHRAGRATAALHPLSAPGACGAAAHAQLGGDVAPSGPTRRNRVYQRRRPAYAPAPAAPGGGALGPDGPLPSVRHVRQAQAAAQAPGPQRSARRDASICAAASQSMLAGGAPAGSSVISAPPRRRRRTHVIAHTPSIRVSASAPPYRTRLLQHAAEAAFSGRTRLDSVQADVLTLIAAPRLTAAVV